MYLIRLNCTHKKVMTVSFILCVFYQNKKKMEKGGPDLQKWGPQSVAAPGGSFLHPHPLPPPRPLLWAWSPPPRGHQHPIRTRPGVSATQPAGDTCRHAGLGLWVPQGSGNLGGPASFICGMEPGTRRLQEGLDELIDGLTGP